MATDNQALAPETATAAQTLSRRQRARLCLYAMAMAAFFLWDYKIAFTALTLALCVFYGMAVGVRLLSAWLARRRPAALAAAPEDMASIPDNEWPVYTILVPLYREAQVVPGLLQALSRLDYPADRLQVLFLTEADDPETRAALESARMPEGWRMIAIPDGQPRTKPRACNHGLSLAKGEFLVIFDAEDRPESDQLKKAVAVFRGQSPAPACLQARLHYHNPRQNWLTRFFALEYAAWFDLFLPGLHHLGFPIPLGGTSNHFRLDVLRSLGGWDAWNVAEDCDLGIRLARGGHQTRMLDSITWEEANSRLGNWLRQRSRWVKGYLQTHLVHTRRPAALCRELGAGPTAGFWLTVGGLAATLLLNPIYWLAMLAWLCWRWPLAYFDFTDAEQLAYTGWSKASWVFFGLSASLFLGNFTLIALNLMASFRPGLRGLWPYAFLSPVYWLLISLGAWKGFWQLLRRPSYWEKTDHGLDERLDRIAQQE